MVAFAIQVNTPSGSSTEQVKVASSPGQTHSLSGETDPPAASEIKHLLWRILTKRSTYRHQHSLGYPDTCFSFADDIYDIITIVLYACSGIILYILHLCVQDYQPFVHTGPTVLSTQ